LTYKIALEYSCRIALKIAPGEFIPPPKVQSAVLVLEPLATPHVRDAEHRRRAYRVLTGIFLHRRRTLANALALGGLDCSKPDAEKVLLMAGIDAARRPETLTLPEVLKLTDAVFEIAQPSGDRGD
jgi:16S rRNA (adenine1518-N6/adenine1519-N6)-dimethyltransferase